MKANEAPDKIWMTDEWVRHFDDKDFMGEDSVEYVRKDAFIEKAVKWLEDNAVKYWGTDAVDNGMMIYDFKNAMKL